jgi:AraC-like DNA-binding protein
MQLILLNCMSPFFYFYRQIKFVMPFVIFELVAIVNLLLLFVLLLLIKPQTKANRLLAIIMLDPVFAMVLIVAIYYQKAASYPVLFYISYLYDLIWAPLFYYYIHLMLRKEIKLSIRSLMHFSLFIAGCFYFVVFALQPEAYRVQVFQQAMTDNYPWQLNVIDYLTIVQVAIYLPLIYNMVKKHNRHIEQVFSNTDKFSAKWVQEFIVFLFFLCAIIYLPAFINPGSIWLYMLFVPLASMVLYCYFVYKVITSPLFFSMETLQLIEQTAEVAVPEKSSIVPLGVSHELANKLEALLVEKKLFLDPDLNIQLLADSCHTKVYILSAFINKHYNKSFFEYINYYRIEEAKMLLADPGQQKYSIDTLAEKSGFRSRSAFYKAFRKEIGHTPGEYIKTTLTQ